MEDQFNERYNRQLILKGFGLEAQLALGRARVLVVGAGGLGCPALLYLAAAGIGTIGIIDHDKVSLSNLHRQTLYNTTELGLLKAELAAEKLKSINPTISIDVYSFELDNINAVEFFKQYDYILDGSDNFATRYLVNDVCCFLKKPLVHAAVSGYEGQVAIFNVAGPDGVLVNYRDLFPKPPGPGEIPNCAEAGVLGVLPGIIGTMQAAELIKLVTGIGEPLVNKLLTYNVLTQQVFIVDLSVPSEKMYSIPSSEQQFLTMDYALECGTTATTQKLVPEINLAKLNELMQDGNTVLIDVREHGETPALQGFQYVQIPLSVFPVFAEGIEGDPVILFCQQGGRSLKAAAILQELSISDRKIFSLKGGVAGVR